jgi:hypothetical protein
MLEPTAELSLSESSEFLVLHLAISGALSCSKTVNSASLTAFKKT